MHHADPQKIPVERVAKPGQAWLELKGTILLLHTHSWVSTNSTFIPIEWIRVEQGARRDFRRLWLGVLSLMVAFLLCLPPKVLLLQKPLPAGDHYMIAFFIIAVVACAALGLAAMVAFCRPRRFSRLIISARPAGMEMDFWHCPGENTALDETVRKLSENASQGESATDFPIRMHHMWRRPRPYRIALIQGLAITALLYPLFACWDLAARYERAPDFHASYYLLLALPPLSHLAAAVIRRGHRLLEPRAYRDAVRYYLQQRNEDAEMALRCLLARQPAHDAGRFLLVQIYAEGYEFDLALQHCKQLEREHPLLASRLQANIWSLRRMHARMEAK